FFSSRRRHTRWPRDWSSDVCSSDLDALVALDVRERAVEAVVALPRRLRRGDRPLGRLPRHLALRRRLARDERRGQPGPPPGGDQIGRASCRERGWMSGWGGEVREE